MCENQTKTYLLIKKKVAGHIVINKGNKGEKMNVMNLFLQIEIIFSYIIIIYE